MLATGSGISTRIRQKWRCINCEVEITTAMEARLLAVDEDCSFIVYGGKVQEDAVAGPVRGNSE